MKKNILTINGGSSSVKFALYSQDDFSVKIFSGVIDGIGLPESKLTYVDAAGKSETNIASVSNFEIAIQTLKTFLGEHIDFTHIIGVGHRVVHGMHRDRHALVTSDLIADLKEISFSDSEHMPLELGIIEMFAEWQPTLPQVACFDTVFHHDMPRVAQLLPLPRRFDAQGVRRYGFHGLSCDFIMKELERVNPEKAKGRIIIAHLGNGASVTAVENGKSIDTSMGFTPTGGVLMSSRTGDIDPGALLYVMKHKNLSPEALSDILNHESGLLGVSEISSRMEVLLDHEATDERAKEAVDLFCYEVKKQIGAYMAALGGLDTLVFTAGIGENAPRVRSRICSGLELFGISLDEEKNSEQAHIISIIGAPVRVLVMHTNEEQMIAHITETYINK